MGAVLVDHVSLHAVGEVFSDPTQRDAAAAGRALRKLHPRVPARRMAEVEAPPSVGRLGTLTRSADYQVLCTLPVFDATGAIVNVGGCSDFIVLPK